MFLKLFADSWNSFFQSSFFFNPQAHRTLPIQEQAHRVNRQLESIKHRFNQLEEICEHGSIVSKELLSSVKNWNLLKEDAFSLILDPINIFQTKTTIDLSANLKKLNKITIQFAKLINCYQTSYGIYVLRNTTKYFPEYYSSILHQELNHLSEKVTKNEIKTQKKLVKEVVEKTFTNYVPIFISLCTGLSSKIAGKLCKFTLLSTKQWYTLEDTKKNQKHLQEFQSIIETAPEETDFLLNQFRSLLITKTKQEIAINQLQKFEIVVNAIWIATRTILFFPSILCNQLISCLEFLTKNILFSGSGLISVVVADSLRKWITLDGLVVLTMHFVAMRSLCPHEYSWDGIQCKLFLKTYLMCKKICIINAFFNYCVNVIHFLATRVFCKSDTTDFCIHSFSKQIGNSLTWLNPHISRLEIKIRHLKHLDLQKDLLKGTDLIEELSHVLAEKPIFSLPEKIHKFIVPLLGEEQTPQKSPNVNQEDFDQKPKIPLSVLPSQKVLHQKLKQIFLMNCSEFLQYATKIP